MNLAELNQMEAPLNNKVIISKNDYTLSVRNNMYILQIKYKYSTKVERLEFNKSYIKANIDKINERFGINLILEMFV